MNISTFSYYDYVLDYAVYYVGKKIFHDVNKDNIECNQL